MNPVPELAPNLKQLRLSGILDSLEVRNRQAIESKLAYTEFLSLLIHDEVARRDQKKFELRLRRAAFRAGKSLEGFDFTRLPNLSRPLIHDLATRVRQTNPQVIDYMQFTHAKLALQRVGGGRRQAYRREEFLLFRCHGR